MNPGQAGNKIPKILSKRAPLNLKSLEVTMKKRLIVSFILAMSMMAGVLCTEASDEAKKLQDDVKTKLGFYGCLSGFSFA
jgi:hypothetical protein